jgi:hypothetical protein
LEKNDMKKIYFISVFAVALLAPCSRARADGSGLSPQEKQGMLHRLIQVDQGRFIISGSVMDEAGQALNGVTIVARKTRSGGPFQEVWSEEERHVVDGNFQFDYRGCLTVTLTFTREGYYPSVLLLNYQEPLVDDDQLLGGSPIPTPLIEKNDLRVVLEKRGNVTQLREYAEVLEYRPTGQGVVMDLDQSNAKRRSLRAVVNTHDAAQLPTNTVYVIAERDEQGRIAVVRKRRPNSSVVDVLPRRLTLRLTGPDAGFIRVQAEPGRRLSSQTKIAPEAGYQAELTILSDDFVQAGSSGGAVYYFKANGKFGKGSTGWVKVNADQTLVQLRVRFLVQPDGSRNLETEPDPHEVLVIHSLQAKQADTTPPVITLLGDNPVQVQCGAAYVDAGATAADDKDGNLTSSIVTSNAVNTAAAGSYTVTYKVSDAAGNQTTATRTVKVLYDFTGFLPPIGGADTTGGTVQAPVKTFKAGSKIPVKFTIGCGIGLIHEGVHTLQVVKWNDETTAAEPIDASPADAATTGNQFRWAEDHWQYILDTQVTNMGVGVWELRATLSDGSKHSVFIGLK